MLRLFLYCVCIVIMLYLVMLYCSGMRIELIKSVVFNGQLCIVYSTVFCKVVYKFGLSNIEYVYIGGVVLLCLSIVCFK